MDKPADAEEHRTQPHTADRGDFEPQKKQTEGWAPRDSKHNYIVPSVFHIFVMFASNKQFEKKNIMRKKIFSIFCVFGYEWISSLGNLAHATVAGLPTDTKKPEVVPEIPKPAQVLPPHTTPSQGFAQEVGVVLCLLSAWKGKQYHVICFWVHIYIFRSFWRSNSNVLKCRAPLSLCFFITSH